MKRFVLDRSVDITGVSGTGVIVEGVKLSSGRVVSEWKSETPKIEIWESIEDMMEIYNHRNGNQNTKIVWLDDPVVDASHCNDCHDKIVVCWHNTCPGCLAGVM